MVYQHFFKGSSVLSFLAFFISCSSQKVSFEVPEKLADDSIKTEIKKIKINYFQKSTNSIKYKNIKAIAYAKKYALLNDNSCGIYNNNPSANLSDCAHFIAHCLKAGGIEIKAATPNTSICKDGLSYRVQELTAALEQLSKRHDNVKAISIDEAIIGDYGFFKIPVIRPTHAFMICAPAADTDDITVYAHTTNRSCSKPEPKWYQYFDVAYRITDSD